MNPIEYEVMAAVEKDHWWYRGLHEAIVRTLRSRRIGLPDRPRILDAGCGTGGGLRMLVDEFHPEWVGGFDFSAQAVDFARRLVPEAEIVAGDITDPPPSADELDLIVSCDVICCTGIDVCRDGLRSLTSRLRPGGLLLSNLPAYRWLYSEHDVAVHTRERFTRKGVVRLYEELGLQVELATYRLWGLFPLVVAARSSTLGRRLPSVDAARSDVRLPARWCNSLLTGFMSLENRGLACGLRYPWGSSVFAIGRKPR